MKKFLCLACLLLVMSFILTGCGGGTSGEDTSWEDISAKGQIVIGLDDSFPPMGFRDGNDLIGYDIDLAKEACSRLGITAVFQPISWLQKDTELSSKNIDCIWNGFTMQGRENDYLFTDAYMTNRQILVVMEDSDIASLADMAGKKLALQQESSAQAALDESADFKDSLAEVVTFDDNLKALMDLEIGQSDAVLMDEIVARYNIEKQGKPYMVLDEELASESYGVGFRLGDKSLRDKFNETLNAMKADGKMEEISMTWFGKNTIAE
ncbi:MAG TPA: amino acid ABC transporter substrate-binding protein [Ruminococcaceae bacterium]|nr:amino acid ABC transporter substrate-binding protein [Oscillospiraceae bacterium]